LSRGSKAIEAKIGRDHGAEEDSEESEDSEGEAVGTGPQKEKSRCNQRGGKKHSLLRGAMLRVLKYVRRRAQNRILKSLKAKTLMEMLI
jgi:hypothetical protein